MDKDFLKIKKVTPINYEEHRRFLRVKLHLPVSYQIKGKGKFNSILTDNISVGGIGFINKDFIAPGTYVHLDVNVGHKVIGTTGKIAWAASLPHSDRYILGIEFLEVNPLDHNFLQNYIDKIKRNYKT